MAELAALGVAASIIQVIDVGIRVLKRLEEYRAQVKGLPKVLQPIRVRLPTLTDALRSTNQALDSMTDDVRNALKPCVDGCLQEMRALEELLKKIVPEKSDSVSIRAWKAIISVKYERGIKEMDNNIERYIQALSNHATLTSSNRTLANQRPPPKPKSTCPFPQDPDFVKREAMNQVMTRCKPGRKLALMGIGGVGKSHIAIEYAYRVRTDAPETWVFWVSCQSAITIDQDFRKIAKVVHIPGWDDKRANIFSSVRDWLKDEAHGSWTMILDNVDDAKALTAPAPNTAPLGDDTSALPIPPIREFFTISQTGSILITSRNTEAAQIITGNCAHHIDVEEMNETEAIALLKSKLNSKVVYKEDEAADLVKAVDYMPLAVSQITTNINLNYPRLTIPLAIEKLQNPSQETTQLLEADLHETSRDGNRSNSIIKTWHLSFQYICESSPSAARLLSLMCLFNRQDIPETLLVGQYEEEAVPAATTRSRPHFKWWKRIRRDRSRFRRPKSLPPRKPVATVESPDFDGDWLVLTNFGLIKTNLDGHHFSMHRLVQHATRRWLELKEELNRWKAIYVCILADHLPVPEPDNEQIYGSLLPHAHQAFTYLPTDKSALRAWALLVKKISEYGTMVGNYYTAEEACRIALEVFKGLQGEKNEDTLKCFHDLGYLLRIRKKYQEAESLLRRAFEGRQALLGVDHPDSISSAALLGTILNAQKKYDEGDVLQLYALDARTRILGPDHIETWWQLGSLLLSAVTEERYNLAVKLHCRMSGVREDITGDELEEKLKEMQILAGFLSLKGDFDTAERIQREVFDVTRRKYTIQEYETVLSVNCLGKILAKQGKLQEAEEKYRAVLDVYGDLESRTREEALNCMDGLAHVLLEQGKGKEAESIGKKLIVERETLLGADHFDTLVAFHTMAKILTQQERFEEAVPLYEKAYVGLEKAHGSEHPNAQEFLDDLNHARDKLSGRFGADSRCSLDNPDKLQSVL